jgi:hypothetical protein
MNTDKIAATSNQQHKASVPNALSQTTKSDKNWRTGVAERTAWNDQRQIAGRIQLGTQVLLGGQAQAAIKWNQGVHNYMTCITGDIPVGEYDTIRHA